MNMARRVSGNIPALGSSDITEGFVKERLHGGPGTLVGGFVIGDLFQTAFIGFGIGETVLGISVHDDLEIGTGLFHFVNEAVDMFVGNEFVVRSGTGHHFRFDLPRLGGHFCLQGAVETDHSGYRRAAAGQLQYAGAAKAVPDGSDAVLIDLGQVRECIEGGADARAYFFRITAEVLAPLETFFHAAELLAVADHIHGKSDVA